MKRVDRWILFLLLFSAILLSAAFPAEAWFSDVLSGASYEFVLS